MSDQSPMHLFGFEVVVSEEAPKLERFELGPQIHNRDPLCVLSPDVEDQLKAEIKQWVTDYPVFVDPRVPFGTILVVPSACPGENAVERLARGAMICDID
jgi:hypothetical protein